MPVVVVVVAGGKDGSIQPGSYRGPYPPGF